MFDCTITVRGWLGGDVDLRRAGDVPVASFRLACTPRRFNRRTETWSDGATQWYTVTCWRSLADNVARSLRRGDPVVVQGRLEMRKYVNSQDVEVEALEIDATAVGHDLARGTSQFTRSPRQEPVTAGTEQAPAA
ncbi:MAG: single-stranded DNA-binding protein [Nocardioides sp.]|nr:single-stranded DNA-binding protein [Nocardioides sp.]